MSFDRSAGAPPGRPLLAAGPKARILPAAPESASPRTPFITGIGLVTPLGTEVASTWNALLAGRYITDHAKVPLDFDDTIPRISHLALRAARQAVRSSPTWKTDADTALFVGTSKGPIESWLAPPFTLSDVKHPDSFGLSVTATHVGRALEISGPHLTISAACVSGLHALIRGAMLIRSGAVPQVLVVAAEASIHPLFIASFQRLGVLPPTGLGCRPFDRSRQGFLMSEAAAAVCLQAGSFGMHGSLAVERIAFGADATHLTGNDPNASTLAKLIAHIADNKPFDLIHAHGTGTVLNDAAELLAIERSIAPSSPTASLYSHKGAAGHSLGAAGLVSVVINVVCHREQIVPPNVRTTNPMPTARVNLQSDSVRREIRRSAALAAGFGGAVAAVSLVG